MMKFFTQIVCVLALALMTTTVNAQQKTLPAMEAEAVLSSKGGTVQSIFNPGPQKLPDNAVVLWGGPGDANGEFDGGLNDWTTVGIGDEDADIKAVNLLEQGNGL